MSRSVTCFLVAVPLLALLAYSLLHVTREGGEPRSTAPENRSHAPEDSSPLAAIAEGRTREPILVPAPPEEPVEPETKPANRPAPLVIRGRVRNEDDGPVVDATVTACFRGSREEGALSDGDGSYRMEVAEEWASDLVAVVASAEGALTQGLRLEFDESALASRELECDLVLRRACAFEVTVVDRQLDPVPGAVVRLADAGKSWGKVPPVNGKEWYQRARLQVAMGSEVAVGETGDDGRCALDGAPCGELTVSVWHPDFVPRIEVPTRDLEGFGRSAVRVILDSGHEVTGRVLAEDGVPVAGAEVLVRNAVSSGSSVTDEEGRFRIEGFDEKLRTSSLICRAEGFAVRFVEEWSLPAAGEAEVVLLRGEDLELALLDGSTGRLVQGPARVLFDLTALRSSFRPSEILPPADRDCREGRLDLHALPEFLEGIEVRVADYDPAYVSFGSGIPAGRVVLVLTRPYTRRLRCLDSATDESLPAFRAELIVKLARTRGGTRATATTLPMQATSEGNVAIFSSSLVPADHDFSLFLAADGYETLELVSNRALFASDDTLLVRLSPTDRGKQ